MAKELFYYNHKGPRVQNPLTLMKHREPIYVYDSLLDAEKSKNSDGDTTYEVAVDSRYCKILECGSYDYFRSLFTPGKIYDISDLGRKMRRKGNGIFKLIRRNTKGEVPHAIILNAGASVKNVVLAKKGK